MEILLELLIEIIGQFVLELLVDVVGRGIGRLLSNRIVRTVLGFGTAVAAGFGGGYWWGARLTELGRTEPPRSLWVSIALAMVFLVLASVRTHREWRWSAARLLGFSLLNAAVATGIVVGFTPRPLG